VGILTLLQSARQLKKLSTNFADFLGLGCVTGEKRLDVGGNLNHDADPRILKGVFDIA